MAGNLVKYGSYSLEAAEAEAEEFKKSTSSSNYMKLVEGENVIRILPPPVGKNTPFVLVHQHRIEMDGLKFPMKFPCPRVHAKMACKYCAEAERLKATGNPIDRDAAYKMLPKLKGFAAVIDRNDEAAGPKILEFGKTIHQGFENVRKSKRLGGDFTDPEKGFDLIIMRSGTTMNDTEYQVLPDRQSSPLGDMAWLEPEVQPDLERFSRVMTDEEIEAQADEWTKKNQEQARGGAGAARGAARAPQTRSAPQTRQAAPPRGRTAGDVIDTTAEEEDDNVPFDRR